MMRNRRASLVGLIVLLSTVAGYAQQQKNHPVVLPFTTASAEAHRLADRAVTLGLDEVEYAQAIDLFRRATRLDPNFAMAHELLAEISLDPGEQVTEQQKAFATRKHASVGEQMAIEWYQDAMDHKLMSAIVKMNDLLRRYPHDRTVVWITTWWLQTQTQNERAIEVFEHSGIVDSPGLVNNMAYSYAALRKFDKAFALMDKYVAAMPQVANPQDSYAEILRMAGHFHESIQHYQAALAINPQFYSSQFGIADTYSLMGDQVQARKEYEIAFRKFPDIPELHKLQEQTREAATYVREGDYEGADRAFQAIATYAHSKRMCQVEADTYRQMAMYQPDPNRGLSLLKTADTALAKRTNAAPILINQEAAQILRARVEAALKTGNTKLVRNNLARLQKMAKTSDDKLIDVAYHGAAGAVDFAAGNYKDAISHLEEDNDNPLSLHLLAAAYQHTGSRAEAQSASETLVNLNDPTLEQALIVPPFRACFNDPQCSGSIHTGQTGPLPRRRRPFLL